MMRLQTGIKEKILNDKLQKYLNLCNFGIEKENVRVDKNGHLALTKHPVVFGDKSKNPYITTDFSESQIEMVTPPCDTIDEVYNFIGALNDIVTTELKDEFLWSQSNPPILPEESLIPVSKYNGAKEEVYRNKLAEKYGKKKQLISGVHFNFSFKTDFLKLLYADYSDELSFKEFKNKIYLNISRNFLKYRWLLVYLTGASPIFHETYVSSCVDAAKKLDTDSFYFSNTYSLRNSDCGYKNLTDFFVSYDSVDEYTRDVKSAIDKGHISTEKEYYSPIRLKTSKGTGYINDLQESGVEYLEIRILDLDPLSEFGVSKDTLKLLHAFLLYMTFKENETMTNSKYNEYNYNDEIVTSYGRKKSIKVFECNEEICLIEKGLSIIDNVSKCLDSLGILTDDYKRVLEISNDRLRNIDKTISINIVEKIKDSSYVDFHMERSREALKYSEKNKFSLRGFEDLELSSQILLRDAIKRGLKIDILDRSENFISLSNGNKTEYVKQATKTSKDTYITALLMENKEVTKKVLIDNDIQVPKGEVYNDIDFAKLDFKLFEGRGIVIKPKSTNFGIGITIFKNECDRESFDKAIDIAFSKDKSILIEEFISGKEYRFLVINDELVGILHRVPANVTGDGKNSITKLVNEKNKDFLRGEGYVKPLEKIKLGVSEEMFLNAQGLDFDYIPKNEEIIYLRENSNISTGGDSLDFTDKIHYSYKDIALKVAKAAKARITGIDIMIKDIEEEASSINHAVIEMNFNPAIHIHCYPYKGNNRHAGEKVLDLLFED
ncbi:bifunctional glutamate--cysteine ligase GshA/glutathione synthetase GshB [uncultured Clostridium sp.]|uniref:bifunctional glutamate--cysteine ligase GshA/glutathione synthetase GshB n=1 Tax=uncultured Clostridium sp. TaxID=59620 RepID=UPI002627D5E9|nr:bifunctional glutamate--cysteine ligase GshA/glutathione synthetase GshB [uncultured Clostridium sp.]